MPQEPQAPYISSSEAAKRFNLTNDHIGLLCRRGKVEGKLLGRLWYVNENSLAAYIQRNIEIQNARREALSKQWRTAWTAGFLVLSIFAYSGNYADAQSIPAPRTTPVEPILFNLSLAVQRMQNLKNAVPMPNIAPLAYTQEIKQKQNKKIVTRREPPFMLLVGDGVVGVAETIGSLLNSPRVPSVHIVYAKDYVEPAVPEPISNALTAAAVVADSYIKNLPTPGLKLSDTNHDSHWDPARGGDIFAGVEVVNEMLGGFNSRMFATYKKAGDDFAAAAAFDAQAVAYVWDKTFAEFGKRFAHDVYTLGTLQKDFYLQSVHVLQSTYNSAADKLAQDSTLDVSISVASVAYTPSLTAAVGDSILAGWWDSAVDFVGNLFVASSDIVAEKFALQDAPAKTAPVQILPQTTSAKAPSKKSSDFLSASKPAAGQTFVQAPLPTLQLAPKTTFAANNYITQDSLNNQFAAWMLVVKSLMAGNTGYIDNQASAALGNGGGGTVNNYYSYAQRIDKLDGVTITNSSINGVSDFSSLGSGFPASSTISIAYGGTGLSTYPTYGQLLLGNSTGGYDLVATSSLGISGGSVSGSVGNWFVPGAFGTTASNATSTLVGFTNGIYSLASSTIGDGTRAGGLTVLGGATTTGNAYFAGNVGIGTASPAAALDVAVGRLRISGNTTPTTGSGLEFGYSGGGIILSYSRDSSSFQNTSYNALAHLFSISGTEKMRIDSTGNVGIGTTTPSTLLSISGSAPALTINDTRDATFSIGDMMSSIDFRSNDTSSSLGGALRTQIATIQENTLGSSQGLSFSTSLAGVFGERMRVNGSGNVGIGTTTPSARLTVAPSARGAYGVNMLDTDGSNSGGLYLGGSGDGVLLLNNAAGTPGTQIHSSSGGITFLNALGGNVGIGTTTPAYILDIYGGSNNTARFTNTSQYNVLTLDNTSGNASLENLIRFANNGTAQWSVGNDAANSNAFTFANSTLLNSSARVVITTAGNVGIGTSTPAAKLTIATAQDNGISLYDTTNSRFTYFVPTAVGASINAAALQFITGGSERVRIDSSGNVGIGTTSPQATLSIDLTNSGALEFENIGTFGSQIQNPYGSLVLNGTILELEDSTGEVVRITGGNFGIGTTTPGSLLTLGGSGQLVSLGNFDSIANTYLSFNPSAASGRAMFGYDASSGNTVIQGGSTKGIEFNVNNGTFGAGTAMVIDTSGNVGIGTTTPAKTLDVTGSARVSNTSGNNLTIETLRSGSTYASSSILFSAPRSDTADGSTATGRGILEVVGNSAGTNSTLYLAAQTAGLTSSTNIDTSAQTYLKLVGATSAANNSANYFQFGSWGNPILTALGSGNVGIGTTSPTSKLHIEGTGANFLTLQRSDTTTASAGLLFNGNDGVADARIDYNAIVAQALTFGVGGTRMTIDSSGNVGIGTTTPSSRLSVFAGTSATDGGFEASPTTGSNRFIQVRDSYLDVFNTNTRLGGSTSHLLLQTRSFGNTGIGTTSPWGFLSINNSTNNAAGQPLFVVASSTATATTTAFIINNIGRVGIGTNSPQTALDVSGSIFSSGVVAVVNGAVLAANGSDGVVRNYGSGNLRFTSSNNSAQTDMIITTAGNVGIGTTSPYAKLSVVGDVVAARFVATTTATSTFAGAIQATCFSTDGTTCLSSGSSLTGTTGQLAYFSGTNTAVGTSSLFISTAGNVGIGTTSPADALSVSVGTYGDKSFSVFDGVYSYNLGYGSRNDGGTLGFSIYKSAGNTLINDNNTSGNMLFAFNATEKARITSAGNFGLGTTSPWAKFSINNSTADTARQPLFVVASSTATATTTLFVISNTGNVGIGTTGSTDQLHVYGDTSKVSYRIQNASSTGYVQNAVQADDHIFYYFSFGSNYVSSTDIFQASGDTIQTTGSGGLNIGATNAAGSIDLYTGGSAVSNKRLTVTSSGNVGIGTSSPSAKLHVYDAAGGILGKFNAQGGTTNATVQYSNDDKNWYVGLRGDSSDVFSIADDSAQHFVVSTTGNVGIGTTSPGVRLDILANGFTGDGAIIRSTASNQVPTFYMQSLNSTVPRLWSFQVRGDTDGSFYLNDSTAGSPRLTVNTSGNVGIGTTTPNAPLDVYSTGTYAAVFRGIGVTSGAVGVGGVGTATGLIQAATNDSLTATANLAINPSGGDVGIGSTTPWRTLSVTGTVGFSSSLSNESGSDNALCIDPTTYEITNGGASCAASSLRYKQNIQNLSYGLDKVLEMRPVSFQWNEASGRNDQISLNVGFIAEEMATLVPEVVEFNASGTPEGIDYDKLTAVLAHAIQEIANISGSFKDALIAWLADSANGITKLFAKEVHTEKLCVGNTCVSEEQFLALVSGAGSADAQQGGEADTTPATSSASTLTLNGNNPQIWQLNTSWQDNLGALFVYDNSSETIYSTSTVDSTLSGTTTIDYWAQVPSSGAWLHAARDVVIPTPLITSTPEVALDEDAILDSLASTTEE